MRWSMVLGACATGALLGLTGCGSGSSTSGSASKAVTVETYDNYFQPATITAQPGKKVTVEFKNKGATLHNFSLKELGVDKDIPVGKSATATFTPASGGTLPFFCKYHEALGMKGTVNVSG
jgi:plastocyanin